MVISPFPPIEKAVGETILNIAKAYVRLKAQREILTAEKALVPLVKDLITYWKQVGSHWWAPGCLSWHGSPGTTRSWAYRGKDQYAEIMDRTKLKVLAGVEPQQRLNVDTDNADEILAGSDGKTFAGKTDGLPLKTIFCSDPRSSFQTTILC